ncbi:hypothetical protein HHK36_012483 [Tetracentron sinense]|uniref:CASP-like protein n=1 Tax=Tetracentron sinense TaxID=13715 RepID=A0A834ZD33_TETSI|nr:hypothetical protein HHK36_012483 [Tetracentron sinense]
MESQYKAGMEGTEVSESRGSDLKVANPKTVRSSDFLLRLLALALTLAPAIVLGVAKETETVAITLVPTLPPLNVPVTAKWQYMSAFVYFVVTNSIACAYATLSLVLSIANRGGKSGLALMLIILDLVMVALLFSGNGAAAAIGVVGYKGNSHAQWNKVCNVFGIYCRHIAASIVLSLLGALVFFLLVVLSALSLHKKSP